MRKVQGTRYKAQGTRDKKGTRLKVQVGRRIAACGKIVEVGLFDCYS